VGLLKTTPDTFAIHKKCIRFVNLPKTLQDAVTITRRLGVKYLWVDALCIIQGDKDDWERESSKMCDVYSNAHLTITADNSWRTSQGIFNKHAFGVPPKKIPYKNGTVVYVREQLGRQHDNYALIMRGVDNPEPINRRAWTLQETLLSNRILRYNSNELIWECNEWRQCECGHGSAAIQTGDEASNRPIRKPNVFGVLPADQIYQKWNEVVMLFTERQLSFDGDKLPALSGLANQFAKLLALAGLTNQPAKPVSDPKENTQYLAGLWYSNLSISLLWKVEDDFLREPRDKEIEFRRPKAWRGPSWSWVAVEGPVNISPLRRFKSHLEIIQASTQLATPDPYGQVKSGHLVVRGRVVHGLDVEIYTARAGDEIAGFTEGKKFAVKHGDKRHLFLRDDGGRVVTYDDPPGSDWNRLSCLMVGTVESVDVGGGEKKVQDPYFLVLRRRKGISPKSTAVKADFINCPVFERVGVSTYNFYSFPSAGTGPGNFNVSRTGMFETAAEETVVIV
jgi:hypothetical protein